MKSLSNLLIIIANIEAKQLALYPSDATVIRRIARDMRQSIARALTKED